MSESDREDHLEQLVQVTGKAINEAFASWNARPKTGPLGNQTAALDQFAAQCAGLSQALELVGQRASEVATEMLEDDDG